MGDPLCQSRCLPFFVLRRRCICAVQENISAPWSKWNLALCQPGHPSDGLERNGTPVKRLSGGFPLLLGSTVLSQSNLFLGERADYANLANP